MRDCWNRILLGGSGNTARRNVFWNTAGSAVYALTSMLLGGLVTRVLGADAGGIFFFAFSTFFHQIICLHQKRRHTPPPWRHSCVF